MAERPPLWPVLVACIGALGLIVVFLFIALGVVRSLYPDLSEQTVGGSLPGLLAGGIASSSGFLVTVLLANRGSPLAALRLVPGRETGRALLVMIVAMLALGQALDSLAMLARLGQHGSMAAIRRTLADAAGADLFAAVVVIGLLAGTAEEVFFRAYLQTRLRQRLRPGLAVLVVSAGFGLLHFDALHSALAFALGLYLGWITELAESALPAVACHVINNVVFTVVTALWGVLDGFALNLALVAVSAPVFAGCALWLRRTRPAR